MVKTVKGVWMFTDTRVYSTTGKQTVNFICAWYGSDTSYTALEWHNQTGQGFTAYINASQRGYTPSMMAGLTIDFGETEQAVSDEFFAWLTANATLYVQPVTFDLSTLNLTGTHTITVKARGTGYIASPASNAVEYPTTSVEVVSWADGTDEQIAAMVAALDDGTLTVEETGWQIGDERTVALSAMEATGVGESHAEQEVTMVLMDSHHYTLTEATTSGDTKDHFVVGMKNRLVTGGYMNSSGSNSGSWSGCARRAWCNEVFRFALPEPLRSCFKQFQVPLVSL